MTTITAKSIDWYEIRIKGHLDQRRIDTFENWKATYQPNGQTILAGPIQDQAALYGILNRLRDLGVFLISINCTSC
jgi:hypothetical protein